MIIARAPLRLGLAGGGTDVEPYVSNFGGEVLNISINKYVYTEIAELTSDKICLYDGSSDSLHTYTVGSVPESDDNLMLCVYRYMAMKFNNGRYPALDLRTFSEVPFGSGLGGSSTATVSMMKALFFYFGVQVDDYVLAQEAFHVERNVFGLSGGAQDHYAAVFGGANHLEFGSGSVLVNSLRVREPILRSLEAKLLLYYTGVSRHSGAIIESQIRQQEEDTSATLKALHRVKANVALMKSALLKGDFDPLYEIINTGWEDKKALSSMISSQSIDSVYDQIRAAGAFAGKISGAGGGGFMWFLAPLSAHKNIKSVLKDHHGYFLDCKFSDRGSEVWLER